MPSNEDESIALGGAKSVTTDELCTTFKTYVSQQIESVFSPVKKQLEDRNIEALVQLKLLDQTRKDYLALKSDYMDKSERYLAKYQRWKTNRKIYTTAQETDRILAAFNCDYQALHEDFTKAKKLSDSGEDLGRSIKHSNDVVINRGRVPLWRMILFYAGPPVSLASFLGLGVVILRSNQPPAAAAGPAAGPAQRDVGSSIVNWFTLTVVSALIFMIIVHKDEQDSLGAETKDLENISNEATKKATEIKTIQKNVVEPRHIEVKKKKEKIDSYQWKAEEPASSQSNLPDDSKEQRHNLLESMPQSNPVNPEDISD